MVILMTMMIKRVVTQVERHCNQTDYQYICPAIEGIFEVLQQLENLECQMMKNMENLNSVDDKDEDEDNHHSSELDDQDSLPDYILVTSVVRDSFAVPLTRRKVLK